MAIRKELKDILVKSPIQKEDLVDPAQEAHKRFFEALRGPKGEDAPKPTHDELVEAIKPHLDTIVESVTKKIPKPFNGLDGLNGEDGKDGKDADNPTYKELVDAVRPHIVAISKLVAEQMPMAEKGMQGDKGEKGKDGSPDKPDDIVAKIHKSKTLIKPTMIEGFSDMQNDIATTKKRTQSFSNIGGPTQLNVKNAGAVVGRVETMNFTGATITPVGDGREVNVVFSASGLTILAATGTIDNTNTAFTFVSKPTIIYVNGSGYRESHGWSWTIATLTATLDSPVGSLGDIYGT